MPPPRSAWSQVLRVPRAQNAARSALLVGALAAAATPDARCVGALRTLVDGGAPFAHGMCAWRSSINQRVRPANGPAGVLIALMGQHACAAEGGGAAGRASTALALGVLNEVSTTATAPAGGVLRKLCAFIAGIAAEHPLLGAPRWRRQSAPAALL